MNPLADNNLREAEPVQDLENDLSPSDSSSFSAPLRQTDKPQIPPDIENLPKPDSGPENNSVNQTQERDSLTINERTCNSSPSSPDWTIPSSAKGSKSVEFEHSPTDSPSSPDWPIPSCSKDSKSVGLNENTSNISPRSPNWSVPGCSKQKVSAQANNSLAFNEYSSNITPNSRDSPIPGSSRERFSFGQASSSRGLTEYMSSMSNRIAQSWAVPGCSRDSPIGPARSPSPNLTTRDHAYFSPPPPMNTPLNLAWNSPIPGCSRDNVFFGQSHAGSRDARDYIARLSPSPPLTSIWDSMKENCQLQANSNYRPKTPEMHQIVVDQIFSPTTQREIRTSILNLFPNGPPSQPVRPVRRPKKGDKAYIVGCSKRPRVPSPKCLTVFQGDKYGITETTNCDEEERLSSKRRRRARNGSANLSKSRFNPKSDEIAARLKMYEKIDTLLGRNTKEEPVAYMTKSASRAQAFSPLPSTSTDNETIMKNDKNFSECLNSSYDIEDIDDDELPEIMWGTNNNYKEKNDRKDSPLAINADMKVDSKCNDRNTPIIHEDLNNNNNDSDDDFCEIQFDKFFQKMIDYNDVEMVDSKPKADASVIDTIDLKDGYCSKPSTVICPATSTTDVICIEDDATLPAVQITSTNANVTNVLNPITTQASANQSPVLRASNKMPTSTQTTQSQTDLVITVPDIEPANTPPLTSRRTWNIDVEFVSETKTNEQNMPNYSENRENMSDVQFVTRYDDESKKNSPNSKNGVTRPCSCYLRSKKKQKEQPSSPPVIVNNENTAPTINSQTATADNGNQTQESNNPAPEKRTSLGECPICLDNLSFDFMASTNCGHVFCLECIKTSLRTSGKRCPTCRKQLKGVGYHQVFL